MATEHLEERASFECPICDKREFKVMGNPLVPLEMKKFIRKEYQVVKCTYCSGYSVNPPIDFSDDEWREIYNISYFNNPSDSFIYQRRQETNEKLNRLESVVESKNIKYLDIGCGEGFGLIEALKRGWECYSVDITDHRIDDAKKSKIHFHKGTLFTANYPSDFFDVIYFDSVLEHVTNPSEYLNEIYRIMKKNGVLYIGVPNEDSLFGFVNKIYYFLSGKNISEKIKPFASPYHIIGFTKKTLLYVVEKFGFEIIEFRNFARKFGFRFFSVTDKLFWILLLMVPIEIIAFLIRKEYYFDIIVKK